MEWIQFAVQMVLTVVGFFVGMWIYARCVCPMIDKWNDYRRKHWLK